jgi:hypothetical protein
VGATKKGAEAFFRHDGILMLPEDGLHRFRSGDESLGWPPDLHLRQLGGIPGPFHLDADGMEVIVTRVLGEGFDRLTKLLELAGRDGSEREVRSYYPRALDGFLQAIQEFRVTRAIQRREHSIPRAISLGIQPVEEGLAGHPCRGLERGQLRAKVVAQHIEISETAQDLSEPVKLAPEALEPLGIEHVPRRTQDGPVSTDCRTHLAELLRVRS